ncbi:outer membrane beta-barrel family protein [Flagellimonas sp. DF-77]|uniref:TonB-dependent receptor domain-containing protein n=1 Tax=Flagellimonas algarum TaxID=3230298 RepID=UPI003396E3D0
MRLTFLFLTLCFALPLHTQQNASLSGSVLDGQNGQPLAFATVVLSDETGSLLTGTVTDGKGNFRITAPLGAYVLEVEFIGFGPQQLPITLKDKDVMLPPISLYEAVESLEGVTIRGIQPAIEQRLDRKVVTIGEELAAQGATAIELMNNLPSVTIGSDGTISFRGSENVRILIDGKLSNLENPAEILQQIPTNTIHKIELITNPSAKYNPDGLNGMINIVLKKNARQGWSLVFGANSILAQRERYNSNIALTYRPNTTNITFEYSNGFGDQITDGNVNRFDLDSQQLTRNNNNRESHFLGLGVDFRPSEKTFLSLATQQNFQNAEYDGQKDVFFTTSPQNDFSLDDFLIRDDLTQSYNADFKWAIEGESHYLQLETNYNRYQSDKANDFIFSGNTTIPSYQELIDDARSIWTFNIDYRVPLGKDTSLELGGESRINRIENGYETNFDALENSNFIYDRDILSSYFTLTTALGPFQMNIGSRFEQYQVRAQLDQEFSASAGFNQNLISVFPSLFLGYQRHQDSPHSYQISFGRRIERPSFNQVNPIRQTTTPQILATGNMKLLPQFSNTLEANYRYAFTQGSLSMGLFYRYIQDEINRIGIFDQDDPNLLRLSYDNFDNNQAFGAEFGGSTSLTSWWRSSLNIELYTRQQRGLIAEEPVSVRNGLVNVKWTQNFRLSDSFSASLFAFHSGPQEILQYELKSNTYFNMGLRYRFAGGKGSLSLNFNDVLGSRRFAFRTFRTVFQEGKFLRDTQQLYVGLSYRMGGKLTSRSRRKRNSNIKADRFL